MNKFYSISLYYIYSCNLSLSSPDTRKKDAIRGTPQLQTNSVTPRICYTLVLRCIKLPHNIFYIYPRQRKCSFRRQWMVFCSPLKDSLHISHEPILNHLSDTTNLTLRFTYRLISNVFELCTLKSVGMIWKEWMNSKIRLSYNPSIQCNRIIQKLHKLTYFYHCCC
jgi:hypothetical protein